MCSDVTLYVTGSGKKVNNITDYKIVIVAPIHVQLVREYHQDEKG